jgi:hypothetical protein
MNQIIYKPGKIIIYICLAERQESILSVYQIIQNWLI